MLLVLVAFALTPLPYSWQEKFVTNYYDCYFFPPHILDENYSSVERSFVKVINLKLGYQWRNKTSKRLQEESGLALPFQVSVTYLKQRFITQRELPIDVVSTSTSTFASLVRGYGTCDQINGSLGLLLSGFCDSSELIELRKEQLGSHSLVRTHSTLGKI